MVNISSTNMLTKFFWQTQTNQKIEKVLIEIENREAFISTRERPNSIYQLV